MVVVEDNITAIVRTASEVCADEKNKIVRISGVVFCVPFEMLLLFSEDVKEEE